MTTSSASSDKNFTKMATFPFQCQVTDSRESSLTFIHFLNSSPPCAAYMRQGIGCALVQIMACRLFGTKPSSKPMLGYSQLAC